MSLSKFWEMVKDREAWCATVQGVEKSQTWLSDWTTKFLPRARKCLLTLYQENKAITCSSQYRVGGGLVAKLCLTPVTPWTVAHQAPLFMGFPRQEYQSILGLPFPSAQYSVSRTLVLKLEMQWVRRRPGTSLAGFTRGEKNGEMKCPFSMLER